MKLVKSWRTAGGPRPRFVIGGLVSLVILSQLTWVARPVEAQHAVVVEDTTFTASDGVRLAVRVMRPNTDERHPVAVTFIPYGAYGGARAPGASDPSPFHLGHLHLNPDYFPRVYGWVRLWVDVRGTGASEGTFCLLCHREQQDAAEIIEWAGRQPWSDGKVAAGGQSYAGVLALLAAAQQPEGLTAVWALSSYSDAYREAAWHNGMFSANLVANWSLYQNGTSAAGTAGPQELSDLDGMLQRMAARPSNMVVLDEVKKHPFYDDFWRERSIYEVRDRIAVPVLLVDGWFDAFSKGALRNLEGIEGSRLVMSPWGHHHGGAADAGFGLDLGISNFEPTSRYWQDPAARRYATWTYFVIYESWLEYQLTGTTTLTDRDWKEQDAGQCDPRDTSWDICYYDLGSLEWKTSSSWPPVETRVQELYLSAEASGSSVSLGDGSLVGAIPRGSGAKAQSYVYSPFSGASDAFSKWAEIAASPRIEVDQRPDQVTTLTYSTDPLEEPLMLAGPMELRFFASTTGDDMDWVVRVSEVSSQGEQHPITTGYLRASHRQWDEDASSPGAPWITNAESDARPPGPHANEYRIDIWDTAWTIRRGARLRITLSSSDVVNHTPGPWLGAINTVHHGENHPSRLIVTVG